MGRQLEIDGSYGEGGGQILRSALALSCLTGTPFRIVAIRKGRSRPGLMPQHLAAVHAAARIAGATVTGDTPGGTELTFSPVRIRGGEYRFDIGTAGAVTLVLQTVIPPLLFAGSRSDIIITGGTHVPFSPSYHYLAGVFAPMLARLGGTIRLTIESCGFYPRGGGRVCCRVEPARELCPLIVPDPGRLLRVTGESGVGNLPFSIAERQRQAARELLAAGGIEAEIATVETPARGKGTFLFLRAESAESFAGATALGAMGKRAEAVGEEAARELLDYCRSGMALDPHLADQLALYLALAAGRSSFTTARLSRHLLTNLWVAGRFLAIRAMIDGSAGTPGTVSISGQ